METIAVIDDDVYIGDMIEEVLKREGYAVLRAYSGTEALFLLRQKTPSLILLDLMLPGLSGEEVLAAVKGLTTPVIVVSAKADVEDKVRVLLDGASDYLTKPFEIRELLARITVQLRGAQEKACAGTLSYGELTLDAGTREVRVGGAAVHLTRTEYAILKYLMQNPGQVLTKTQILERVSEDTPDCMESSLKVHVSNLRKKLSDAGGASADGAAGKRRDYIESVWGIGFKLAEE